MDMVFKSNNPKHVEIALNSLGTIEKTVESLQKEPAQEQSDSVALGECFANVRDVLQDLKIRLIESESPTKT